jgi:hypothetical protein
MVDAPFGRFGWIDKPRIPRLFRTRTGGSQMMDEHIDSAAVVRDKAKPFSLLNYLTIPSAIFLAF